MVAAKSRYRCSRGERVSVQPAAQQVMSVTGMTRGRSITVVEPEVTNGNMAHACVLHAG